MTKKNEIVAGAMSFYHSDGLPAAWKQASKFAGRGGRIATAPDIIDARLATSPEDYPWSAYFTTNTAEYFGLSKHGKHILIIAHGVGPMATLEGIQKAYSWQYKDETRTRQGGRITDKEFRNLEDGKYGKVEIVAYETYCAFYEYPLCGSIRTLDALDDPVLLARLGERAEEYINAHTEHARRWHRVHAGINPDNPYNLPNHKQYAERTRLGHKHYGAEGSDPYILSVDAANNCSYGSPRYGYRKIEEGYAIAHLVSIGQLVHTGHQYGDSLIGDVGLHEWSDGVRFVAIKQNQNSVFGIQNGPNPEHLLHKYWRELFVTMTEKEEVGLRALMQVGNEQFTQYPKQGESMDSYEPEYLVTGFEKVGSPVQFKTTVGGYHGLFRYGINEMKAITPSGANAYKFVSDPEIVTTDGNPTHHTCQVQFYRVSVDTTKRLMRAKALRHDYDRMMLLMEKEVA